MRGSWHRLISLILLSLFSTQSMAASTADEDLIERELLRAKNDPDNSTEIRVDQPIALVFDALLTRLAEYTDDVVRIDFDHGNSETPGELGVGSERITLMKDGRNLVQRIVLFEPPRRFAYYTDIARSTVSVPIDYSIGYYDFSEQDDGDILASVSVTYKPSSRFTAFLVRIGFNRALSRDFHKAEDYLNSLEQ